MNDRQPVLRIPGWVKRKAQVHPKSHRRLPVGAEVFPEDGVHFRVWASRCQRVEVMLEGGPKDTPGALPLAVALAPEAEAPGYFSALVTAAGAGTLYRYRLDGDPALYPDPVSRFQPSGPPGPSQVIDPGTFQWSDGDWPGVPLEGQVIYEMHLGTFTPEGTWEAASRELPELADAGMTLIEIMPVADFPGRFGWGYDGVNLFAPTQLYGAPDDCRRFVDQAHALGLGVRSSPSLAG
jgi:maltooligosyltrehalose trehalohydrolase